ncbi:bifunctional diguanylate cyclase/phosphodiesterase [Aliivibrio kagoshimensis]|uniref:bifunctional diguanylate cyclase/phosphodiesterase n=1 Tax=Aliivibrio kagoshimensis TaxID=2910230 RepID=UPI003D0E61A1
MRVLTDQKLIRLIKFAPAMLIGIFAVIVVIMVISSNQLKAKKRISNLRTDFYSNQRTLIQNQIDHVVQQIEYEKSRTKEMLEQTISNRIYEAHRIATQIYQQNSYNTEQQNTRLITDALRTIRFNQDRGYFFIYKTAGENIMHPLLPHLEGKSLWNFQDNHGAYIVREMGEVVKAQGEAFYHWWFVKPQDKQTEYEKIGFGKYFEPYDWFIGTGDYLVDVEDDIKAKLLPWAESIEYRKDGFIFIYDENGNVLADGETGKHRVASAQDEVYASQLIEVARKGGGFLEYNEIHEERRGEHSHDSNGAHFEQFKHLAYVKGIPEWGWTVGTAVHMELIDSYLQESEKELEQENLNELNKILVLTLVLTITLAIFSFFLSKSLSNRFKKFQHRISSDFEELELAKNKMQYMAQHDALTRLPNRVMLIDRIAQGIKQSKASNEMLAVMFIDLDDFKKVNDLYGHTVGDDLLLTISEAFQKIAKPQDTIARFGGDEFIFCFPMLGNQQHAYEKVQQIRAVFSDSFNIDGKVIFSSCSIGVAMYPSDSDTPEELISKADIVLYKSKARHKGDVLFFDKQIDAKVQYDLLLEQELRLALQRNEIQVHYQPQIDAETGTLYGVEALARWQNVSLGIVSPFEFIAVAESNGLIDEIGQFIIQKACQDVIDWMPNETSTIKLSINISPKQLMKGNFIEMFTECVANCDIEPSRVTVEITENVLINDEIKVSPVLQTLRDLGFSVSLDDFGTGYSSLSYLNNLPINEIKIDRSFIDKLLVSPQSDSLVKAIIAIAESCEMKVVAEGVETKEQYQQLLTYHCDVVQGYYFDRPMPLEELKTRYSN